MTFVVFIVGVPIVGEIIHDTFERILMKKVGLQLLMAKTAI